ncbi:hypothetical protein ACKI1O_52815, partial [Streptomyces scabiei]
NSIEQTQHLISQLLSELKAANNRDVLELIAQQSVDNTQQNALQHSEQKQALETLISAIKNQPRQVVTQVSEKDQQDGSMPT